MAVFPTLRGLFTMLLGAAGLRPVKSSGWGWGGGEGISGLRALGKTKREKAASPEDNKQQDLSGQGWSRSAITPWRPPPPGREDGCHPGFSEEDTGTRMKYVTAGPMENK